MSLKPPINENDHQQGTENAAVTIVEFGDYQCTYCAAAHPIVKEIQETFGNQINFVFRNFPLATIHPLAKNAAISAEAAAMQGKFWQMHDAIFEQQSKLSEDFLIQLAEELDLDLSKFRNDSAAQTVADKLEFDFESAVRSGVNGTPTFFVNGERFDGGAIDLYAMLKESTN
jgi:protein-disulfide isomerase